MPEANASLGLLRFSAVLVEKIWGGRRLEEVFGRSIPAGRKIGESWEISGLREALTPVAEGPLRGADLYRLAAARGEEVFGKGLLDRCREDFPLLVKFIDASDVLSVQVHPADEYARAKGFPNGKSEAWVVVAAEPGAVVYRGFKEGTRPEDFRRALDSGENRAVEECLRRVEARPGDVIDLPAGTVHAIGKGLLLCEIQQSSDLTYRVYDWGRMGLDGRPRPLHLKEASDVMSFEPSGSGTLDPVESAEIEGGSRAVYRDSPPFHLEIVCASGRSRLDSPGDRFEIVCVLAGRGSVVAPSGEETPVGPGGSGLVPASWEGYELACGEKMRLVRAWVA